MDSNKHTDIQFISFGIIKVYSLQGMVFENNCEDKKSKVVTLLDRCVVAIAQSVNEASKLLTGDLYIKSEDNWQSQNRSKPPYLLIYFKENAPLKLKDGDWQEVHETTSEGMKELLEWEVNVREWEDNVLPRLVTTLTINLSTYNRQVNIIPVDSSIFGVTKDGRKLEYAGYSGSTRRILSAAKSTEQINTSLDNSRELLPILTIDVCRNFYMALNEPDRMKQFLGYFHFIERYIHSTYKTIGYNDNVKVLFNVPQRIEEPVSKFFENIFSDSKSLAQRFHWCAILVWDNIEEDDVNDFLQAKKVRDKLSHGEHVAEPELPVEKVKKLALKILCIRKT